MLTLLIILLDSHAAIYLFSLLLISPTSLFREFIIAGLNNELRVTIHLKELSSVPSLSTLFIIDFASFIFFPSGPLFSRPCLTICLRIFLL